VRLLYVIDSLAPGGAETSLAEMAPGLVAAGIDLHILPLGRARDLEQRLEEAGAVVHRRPGRPGRVENVRTVMEMSRQIEPGLIHTTLYEADIAGRTAARLLGKPSSTSIVSDSYGPAQRAEFPAGRLAAAHGLDALTARWATRFHAVSQSVAGSVAPRLGLRRNKVDVIPRGRDPQRYRFRSAELRERTRVSLGIDASTPVVLAVGRHEPPKGLEHLLAAAPSLAAEHSGLVVLIAGKDGRSTGELRRIAAGLDLDIRLLGHRTDVPELLAAADVFCLPSEREGFPGVLLEALAVGCPVVASSISGSYEVLGVDDPVGRLFPVGDQRALADALNQVLRNPTGNAESVRRGRARFEEFFTIDAVSASMVRFFERVLEEGKR